MPDSEGKDAAAKAVVSKWVAVDQALISAFGHASLDPDPMHTDPEWARANGPYGGTIAFGFLTISLLTHLLHDALAVDASATSWREGLSMNYGFDRLRLVEPVRAGDRVRGLFVAKGSRRDTRGRTVRTLGCTVEIEGRDRPALVADWLTIYVPADAL